MSETHPASPPRDYTARLQLFGVLALICGSASCGLGLLHLLLPRLDVAAGSLASLWMSAVTYVAVGAVLIWAGIGSLRRKRWVRSVMLVVSGSWLLTGLFGTLLVVAMLDELLELALLDLETPPAGVLTFMRVVLLAACGLVGIALPAAFLLAYRDPGVFRTCAAANPQPAWTERCPLPVLGFSLGLAAVALFAIPLSFRPVVPWFGKLITGAPGALAMLAFGAVSAALARWTYRLAPAAWWSSALLLVVVAASVVLTFNRIEPAEYLRALGYPEAQLEVLASSTMASREVTLGTTILLTAGSLVYMMTIRRHFGGDAATEHA